MSPPLLSKRRRGKHLGATWKWGQFYSKVRLYTDLKFCKIYTDSTAVSTPRQLLQWAPIYGRYFVNRTVKTAIESFRKADWKSSPRSVKVPSSVFVSKSFDGNYFLYFLWVPNWYNMSVVSIPVVTIKRAIEFFTVLNFGGLLHVFSSSSSYLLPSPEDADSSERSEQVTGLKKPIKTLYFFSPSSMLWPGMGAEGGRLKNCPWAFFLSFFPGDGRLCVRCPCRSLSGGGGGSELKPEADSAAARAKGVHSRGEIRRRFQTEVEDNFTNTAIRADGGDIGGWYNDNVFGNA